MSYVKVGGYCSNPGDRRRAQASWMHGALRMGSVLKKEMSCLFPAPLQSLISSEEDLNTLRFCDQNGLSGTIRRGGTADPFSCLTAPSAQLQSPLAMACPMPHAMLSLIDYGLD